MLPLVAHSLFCVNISMKIKGDKLYVIEWLSTEQRDNTLCTVCPACPEAFINSNKQHIVPQEH